MSEFMRADVISETLQSMVDPDVQAKIDRARGYWSGKDLSAVVSEMPIARTVNIDDMRDVQVVEIKPVSSEVDEDRAVVLALPYLQGYTPHHYIRARTLQMLASPNSTLWLLPNSVDGKPAYTFSGEQQMRLNAGDMRPMGEVYAQAFENIDRRREYGLGTLSITGYSQGGLTALAMGATNSDLQITHVNADEAPSVTDRSAKELNMDFLKSSGLSDPRGAIKDAEIAALSEAMSLPRLAKDLARFVVRSTSKEAKMLNEAMRGSADYLVSRAVQKGILVKLGFVAGSSVFSPDSIQTQSSGLELVKYGGEKFRRHPTGDNVILHALMADQGINR